MPGHAADRNLLFGILALQMDFIARDALIAAMHAWVLAKHRPIGEILVEQGALSPKHRALLEPMVEAHVERHGGDPAASLAALGSAESAADDLRGAITDPDVLASVARSLGDTRDDPDATRDEPHATRAPASAEFAPASVRYRKVRDHAKGGLGVVFVAHDEELRREVALKEIQDRHADDPAKRARFLVEAEITGGLEHPGIVPVYGLGHYDDGRPFYAMRFIKGDSLKDAIAAFHADERLGRDPGARALALQKLLRRFLDVCNAVAYAHSRGVLHRDLKPDNVMVGRFGETLVVDWGLAKAVGRSGDDGQGPLPESTILVASSSGSAETLPGSVIGTPSYMSPEQAAGRPDLLGPASDVYSLGATLYTLLTGQVPFTGKELTELLRRVERGDFPRPREHAPWLDPALEAITLKAMATAPDGRYPSPKALADDVERWLADEPVAAHREPWTRRARRRARKHRTAVTATASTALVAALLVGAYAWSAVDRARRADAAGLATLDRAGFLEAEARKSDEPTRWLEAIAEARRAEAQLESGGSAARSRAGSKLAELQGAFRAVERDREMVAALDEARLLKANIKDGHFDGQAMFDAALAAFRSYGIDLRRLSAEDAASRIRPSRISVELVAVIDEMAPNVKEPGRDRLLDVARLADADARGSDIRDRIARKDFEGLRRLVAEESGRRELGARCRTVFNALADLDPTASLDALEAIHRTNRADFWLTHDLARACHLAQPPRLEAAIRHFHAAVALRPASPLVYLNFGHALASHGEHDAAIAAYRDAIRLDPGVAGLHNNLGESLRSLGRPDEAAAEYREAIRLDPGLASPHYNLGRVAREPDAAIAEYREAIRLDPAHDLAHYDLGVKLAARGEPDAAIAEYREAIRLGPGNVQARGNLGVLLAARGELDAAVAEYREAIRLRPDDAVARQNLGAALNSRGERDAALAEYREAIRLRPDFVEARVGLGDVLLARGEADAAVAELRESVRLAPGFAGTHHHLGYALYSRGELDAAVVEYREAIRLDPASAEAHAGFGAVLNARGETQAAIAEYREAIRLNPGRAEVHNNLGGALNSRGERDAALAEFREAIRLRPDNGLAHGNLGLCLKDQLRFAEALVHLERGHALGSRNPEWARNSAKWVEDCRRLVDLDAKLPAFLKGESPPVGPGDWPILADICYRKSLHAASARAYERAFAEQPQLAEDLDGGYRYNAACAAALAGIGEGKDDPPPDEPARAKLRAQALDWLRADLSARGKVLEGQDARARQAFAEFFNHAKGDADLAGLRDEPALAKLPEAEREAFRALWSDVDKLLEKARAGAP